MLWASLFKPGKILKYRSNSPTVWQGFEMPALVVKLPKDRDFCGELRLIGASGAVLAGPFAIAGRAAQASAEAAGNATRSPLARFGDTPTGRYKIRGILRSGAGTAYHEAAYGGSGIVVLDPCGGDAALAEANGRFHVFIQGGAAADGRLGATNGALRMRDEDLGVLSATLEDSDGVECWVVEDAAMPCGRAVILDSGFDEGDPPPLIRSPRNGQDVGRRRVLGGGAMLASSVLLPGMFVAAAAPSLALAQNAYDNNDSGGDQGGNPGPDNNGQQPDQNNHDNNNDNSSPRAY